MKVELRGSFHYYIDGMTYEKRYSIPNPDPVLPQSQRVEPASPFTGYLISLGLQLHVRGIRPAGR